MIASAQPTVSSVQFDALALSLVLGTLISILLFCVVAGYREVRDRRAAKRNPERYSTFRHYHGNGRRPR